MALKDYLTSNSNTLDTEPCHAVTCQQLSISHGEQNQSHINLLSLRFLSPEKYLITAPKKAVNDILVRSSINLI